MAPAQGELLAPKELTPVDEPVTGLALVIERLAANPSVDVAKLEKIIELQERILHHEAEAEFNRAFAEMQPKIPTIVERSSTDKTTYAPLEDIIEPLRPILSEFGFSLSHQTEATGDTLKIVGILMHRGGHSRRSEFIAKADQTGSKNAIQALGSTRQYGRRYTTQDLLCIVTRKEDDDGEWSEKSKQPASPDGYDAWFANLDGIADEGMAAFSQAWNKSPEGFRRYLSQTAPKMLAALKTKASKVKA